MYVHFRFINDDHVDIATQQQSSCAYLIVLVLRKAAQSKGGHLLQGRIWGT